MGLSYGLNPGGRFVIPMGGASNFAAGGVTDQNLNFAATVAFVNEVVAQGRPFIVRGFSYTWLQGPVGVGTLTLTPFKGVAGAAPADPGATYDVAIPAVSATQRGKADLAVPLKFDVGDALSVKFSTDAAWNVATCDLHVWAHCEYV